MTKSARNLVAEWTSEWRPPSQFDVVPDSMITWLEFRPGDSKDPTSFSDYPLMFASHADAVTAKLLAHKSWTTEIQTARSLSPRFCIYPKGVPEATSSSSPFHAPRHHEITMRLQVQAPCGVLIRRYGFDPYVIDRILCSTALLPFNDDLSSISVMIRSTLRVDPLATDPLNGTLSYVEVDHMRTYL